MHATDEIDELITGAETQEDRRISFNGTSRKGTLKETSRNELRKQFGDPDGPFGKIHDQWVIRFPDGTVATIYDYYSANKHAPDDKEVDWSIGGHSEDAVEMLQFLGMNAETR